MLVSVKGIPGSAAGLLTLFGACQFVAKLQSRELEKDEEKERSFKETRGQSKD
jgi:hypothetical protein